MEVLKKLNYSRLAFYTRVCKNHMSSKPKPKVELDHEVNKNIEDCVFKPKKHPGRFKAPCSQLPTKIIETITSITKDVPVKSLVEDGQSLSSYLYSRQPPQEECDIKETKSQIHQEVRSKYDINVKDLSDDQRHHFRQVISNQVTTILKQRVYNWQKLDFNDYFCLIYMFSRASQNYAVVHRIFSELSIRCPDFKPKTLFDFGSGIGTVSWAAESVWKGAVKEFYCVDSSSTMNDLASLILREGKIEQLVPRGVFYRQFLPSQHRPYNLVVSAYSLLELPSSNSRLETLLNLWEKTEDYLVVVEQGTMAGYKVVLEARDFILSLKDKEGNPTGHVFAPCPHDLSCPTLSSSRSPCNFIVSYFILPIGQREGVRLEKFSFVVLKKGPKSTTDPQWPRLVHPVLKKSKHAICRMCTNSGTLQEVIFTAAKSGKITYRCARSSTWGDLLPVNLKSVDEIKNPSKE